MEGESAESLGCKIFIGGLSWETTEQGLRYYFEKFGELTDVAVMIDKKNNQPRGFGFITFKDHTAADLVLAQEHTIDGRLVDIKRAVPRDKAPSATSRYEFRKIFVGGLSPDVTDKELSDYFSKFGTVKDSVIMIDRKTSRSRGFGFVTFESDDSLNSVLRSEHEVRGKWVEVKRAEPRETRPNDLGMGGYDMRVGAGMRRPLGGRDDPYCGGGYGHDQFAPSARNAYPYAGAALRNNYPVAGPQGGYVRGGYNPALGQGGYGYGGAVAGGPAAGYYGGAGGYGGGYGGMAAGGGGPGQQGAGGYRNVGASYPGYGAPGDVGGAGVDPMIPLGADDGYGAAPLMQQQQYGGGGYGAGGGYGGIPPAAGYGSGGAIGGAPSRSGGGAIAAATGRIERSYRPY